MTRYQKLSNYIISKRDAPFEWGQNDCVLFAFKGLEMITGQNHYQSYLPYSTEEQAYNIVRECGGIEKMIMKHLGQGHKNILKAKRGDIVLLKAPELTCGLVDDSGQFVVATGKDGLKRLPLSNRIKRVWSY